MKNNKNNKTIIIVSLIVAVALVSIGFAAFSSKLNITSTATVKPNSSSFNVLLSSSNTSQISGSVSATTILGATADNATINATTISGLKAKFTEPGQSVTYTFYAHNAGEYTAYLRNIIFGNATGANTSKSCTADQDTTESLVTQACDGISLSVQLGTAITNITTALSNHPLLKDEYEPIIVTIAYSSTASRADGDFSVTFGDISLEYSSVDSDTSASTSEITFTVTNGSNILTTYNAENGMTWGEWIETTYNTGNFWKSYDNICGQSVVYDEQYNPITSTDTIISNHKYFTVLGEPCEEEI